MGEQMTGDVTPYEEKIKTDHADGELRLSAYYPYWHNKGSWHARITVIYEDHPVGSLGRAFNNREEAITYLVTASNELKKSFDPSKRISSDDLNWRSR